MKVPLINEEQSGKKTFTSSAQIVINLWTPGYRSRATLRGQVHGGNVAMTVAYPAVRDNFVTILLSA